MFGPKGKETKIKRGGVEILRWLLVLGGAVIMSRLFFVTVIMGEHYSDLASSNQIKQEKVRPMRGTISDREGTILAGNILVEDKVVRHYPLGEITAGVVGYVGEISEGEMEECGKDSSKWLLEGRCYGGQVVGKTGVEKWYESRLAGGLGMRLLEESAAGEDLSEIRKEEAINGENIKLNLSIDLQAAVHRALSLAVTEGELSGGVAMVSTVRGEVLSLVSLPSFDPNLFVEGGERGAAGGKYKDVVDIVGDKEGKPLFNRAVAGVYPPGSVFKTVVATAGLGEGTIDIDETIEDVGEIKVGGARFGNWYFDRYGKTEGLVDVKKALARSNDIFFYKLGERLGVDSLVEWSGKFGVGEKTGIDLVEEVSGLLPSPLWREKTIGERWYLGNTYHMAIGQGDLMVTPAQVDRWTAAVVSGKKCELRLQGEGECEDLGIGEENRKVVVEGMKQACMSGGTGYPFFDLEGRVVCKTGTAQQGGEDDEPHAWITVVVPEVGDEGEYLWSEIDDWRVVTVLLEGGGEGSEKAAPVARKIVESML